MFKVNENYLRLPSSYLFSAIAREMAAYEKANPDRQVIRPGIGDVTLLITPAIVETIYKAAGEMGHVEAFHGYASDLGYASLRETIVEKDYKLQGCHVETDEIFVSDRAKSNCGNIQEIFSEDSHIAVCDPICLVYVDSGAMTGRTGSCDSTTSVWSNMIYMPCTARNHSVPAFPEEAPDLIYLCISNNSTGTTLTRSQLKVQVGYANRIGAVILHDVAYEAYISEEDVPHSVLEIQGARIRAIGFRSFPEKAGFTDVRLGFTVIPKDLKCGDVTLHLLWAGCYGTRFNGVPYIEQRAGKVIYSEEDSRQVMEQVAYYKGNARAIYDGLKGAGHTVLGGTNSPYVRLKVEDGMDSWEFFDYLLGQANVVGTPGDGFGLSGQGYFRLAASDTYENTVEAVRRIKTPKQ